MKVFQINGLEIIQIPKIVDVRGNLAVIEGDLLPFSLKRVYFLYDIPSGAYRGGHAHREQQEFLIAVSGSFKVVLQDRWGNKEKITLNKPNEGLLIPKMTWREIENFSSGAICLVVASEVYDENDYIRDFDEFLSYIN
jgi:dTDP-4-dehydrorhamnose 3,5-epimerase-like enzyme